MITPRKKKSDNTQWMNGLDFIKTENSLPRVFEVK